MIDGMTALLTQAGVPAAQIRYEVFEAAVAAASSAPARSAPAAAGGTRHRVQCAKSGAELTVPRGRTLLEAAEDGGVEIASLCRAGVCGTCRVQVTDGNVDCDSSTLAPDEVDAGFVLACVATLRSDCVVNL
jgi:NADH oxidoreductase Hcr